MNMLIPTHSFKNDKTSLKIKIDILCTRMLIMKTNRLIVNMQISDQVVTGASRMRKQRHIDCCLPGRRIIRRRNIKKKKRKNRSLINSTRRLSSNGLFRSYSPPYPPTACRWLVGMSFSFGSFRLSPSPYPVFEDPKTGPVQNQATKCCISVWCIQAGHLIYIENPLK